MDLLYRYEVFSREVLTLAREHPILRYAACAVAAKQLGQLKGPVSRVLRGKTQENIAARLSRDSFGFAWYGAKYYEKAIKTLVRSITPKDPVAARIAGKYSSPAVSLSGGDLMVQADGEDPIVRLLGTCILIQYEHLSANRDAWSGHLTGFSKLLDLIDEGNLLHPHPMVEQVYPWTKHVMEVKAGFWNFVVNDLEESFVSHRRTRIDTENLALWRNMGLLIEDDGSLSMTGGRYSLTTTPEHARNKVLSYTLIRLLCKLVDYVAPISHWQSFTMPPESPTAIHGKTAFRNLESQLDSWHQMLSPSFHPDGTFVADGNDDNTTDSSLFDREVWFSNDLCSTTMLYYHMARMLLLIHMPSDLLSGVSPGGGRASFDLLRALRHLEQQSQSHASEVIAIVRGTPCDAVKLRAIQPLYVAGRCCSDSKDRKALVETLMGIQYDLGIETGYRVEALVQEWGSSYQGSGN
ncbi:hypothetical protein IL306_010733 [Fusarium sp. DS 682]|nr:hypothetical protein IL306_010733 [Fusarium sp. DS 682]